MTTRKLRQKDGAVYFATFTCHQWVPLFREPDAYDIVYNWMHIAHEKGYRFFGYAIMPNHAHFVILNQRRVVHAGHPNNKPPSVLQRAPPTTSLRPVCLSRPASRDRRPCGFKGNANKFSTAHHTLKSKRPCFNSKAFCSRRLFR